MLHALPTPASLSDLQILPPCHPKGSSPSEASISFSHDDFQDKSGFTRPNHRPPLNLQYHPDPSTADLVSVWSLIFIKIPTKNSPLKGWHVPSANEASCSPGACDSSTFLQINIFVKLVKVCLFLLSQKREREKKQLQVHSGALFHLLFTMALRDWKYIRFCRWGNWGFGEVVTCWSGRVKMPSQTCIWSSYLFLWPYNNILGADQWQYNEQERDREHARPWTLLTGAHFNVRFPLKT